jgi:hypothetical protein
VSEPKRSEALKRALAGEREGLPEDFAAHVAALAEAESAARSRWAELVMISAFVAMMGVCVAGWFVFVGPPAAGGEDLLQLAARVLGSQPWLVIGVAGVVVVQLLTFGRRARI